MAFLKNFELISGIAVILPLNFSDSYAVIDTTAYFEEKKPIDIFMKKVISDNLYMSRPLN